MEKQHKDAVWVPHAEIEPEVCGKGVKRRILAYSKGCHVRGKYL